MLEEKEKVEEGEKGGGGRRVSSADPVQYRVPRAPACLCVGVTATGHGVGGSGHQHFE